MRFLLATITVVALWANSLRGKMSLFLQVKATNFGLTAATTVFLGFLGVLQSTNANGTLVGSASFEEGLGLDSQAISNSGGLSYVTSDGYHWLYADATTGQYNMHSVDLNYGNGSYNIYGNVSAWLGPSQGIGRIDFPRNDGKWLQIDYSSGTNLYLEAYGSFGQLLDSASGGANLFASDMSSLRVDATPTRDISYVLVHDSGNYFTVDNVSFESASNLPQVTFSDVMSNSVTRSGGAGFTAMFSPNLGYTVGKAAALGDFDHFNWLQLVVADLVLESPLKYLVPSLQTSSSGWPSVPFVDPPYGGYRYQIGDCGSTSFPTRDSLDWYWDEVYGSNPIGCDKPEINTLYNPNNTQFIFEDFPSSAFNIDFETYLVGIRPDGTGVAFTNLNTNFLWSYSGFGDWGVTSEILGNADPALGGDGTSQFLGFLGPNDFTGDRANFLTSLGITLMNTENSVPSPSTVSLLIIGFIALRIQSFSPRSRRTRT